MGNWRFGKCPMCNQEDQMLYFAIGSYRGKLWCNYICAKCLTAARDRQKTEEKQHDESVAGCSAN